jgi:hypothetical protein
VIRVSISILFLSALACVASSQSIRVDPEVVAKDSVSISRRIGTARFADIITKDSASLFEYRHTGEFVARFPGAALLGLGSEGQPSWLSINGSLPGQFSLIENGLESVDPVTGTATLLLSGIEDAMAVSVLPAHEAFWHAGGGRTAVVEVVPVLWRTTRPFTRLRHTEAPYDFLNTDIIFNVNPSPTAILHVGINRQSNGVTGNTNPARFSGSRFESWLTRLAYTDRIAGHFTLNLRHEYGDALVYLNGGVSGSRLSTDSTVMVYADRSIAEETAFNPILAPLANATMVSQLRRHLFLAEGAMDWTGDSLHVTTAALSYRSQARHFSDRPVNSAGGFANDDITRDDSWLLVDASLRHESTMGPLTIKATGRAAWLSTDETFITTHRNGLIASVGGMAIMNIGSTQVRAFTRLDHRMGNTAVGIGGGIDVPIGDAFALRGGASASSRLPTLFETDWRSPRMIITGEATGRQDKSLVAEAGLRHSAGWSQTTIQACYQANQLYSTISTGYLFGDASASDVRFLTQIDYGARREDVLSVSFANIITAWDLNLETRGRLTGLLKTSDAALPFPFPEREGSVSLYYRGMLISRTLELKIGASASFCSAFQPGLYNPETDLFTIVLPGRQYADGLASYTARSVIDVFLFATVKEAATIHIVLHNALDARYITTAFYPMYDRSIRFGADWVLFD